MPSRPDYRCRDRLARERTLDSNADGAVGPLAGGAPEPPPDGAPSAFCDNHSVMAKRHSSFGKDTGLQARMLLTMFLLGLVYVVFVGVLIAAGAGAVTVVAVALVLLIFQLFSSDKIAMATMGVKEVSPAEQPELHGIIERLCVQADLPKPRVCVMETSMLNAFAMGRSQKSATVCATTGIIAMLKPAELEGVLAHELTHVINRDVMVMTLASFFATLASLIAQFALFFGGGFGGGYGRNQNEEEEIMLVLLVSVVVYAISFLLLRALSRYREFAADRGSAVLTGRPSALASASAEDQRHDGARADPGPAQGGRHERLLHHPAADEEVTDEHLRRPPAARAASGGAGTAGVSAPEPLLTWACATS